jgi:uncharacterized protein YjbI with pentapeptide repeats
VLLLRSWSEAREGRVSDEVLASQLQKAGEELEVKNSEDAALFREVDFTPDFVAYVSRLCEQFGDLIIVLDQFEELLRVKRQLARDMISFLSRLYQSEPRVRLLVSLRDEYHKDLRPLEYYVGGLYGRTYWLYPLTVEDAQGAVLEAASRAGLPEETLKTLLGWHAQWQMQDNPQEETHAGHQDADLLTLQAVLAEYQRFYTRKGVEPSDAVLREYKNNRTVSVLVGESLLRWIESSFEPAVKGEEKTENGEIPLPLPYPNISDDYQYRIMRHCAWKMAGHFSSGSFKVLVHEDELISRSLEEDFRALLPHFATKKEHDIYVGSLRSPETPAEIFAKEEAEEGQDVRSGLARAEKWTRKHTAKVLRDLALESLKHLEARNVVRSSSGFWELVHDGFAKPFLDWADTQRFTIDDALASLHVLNGQDVVVTSKSDVPDNVVGANWHGGSITSEGTVEALLSDRHFTNCDLRGVIFDKCDFRNATFTDCILDGAIFKQCKLEGAQFERGVMRGALFLLSSLGKTAFLSTQLLQVGFLKVDMTGEVNFSALPSKLKTPIESTRFVDVTGAPEHKLIFDQCDLRFCSWGQNVQARIAIQPSCRTYNCGAMPEAEVKRVDNV